MEEQQARPGSPPVPVHPSRRPYSPEHKQAILRAFAVWKGTKRAFCELQGIHQATLKAWEEGRLHPGKARAATTRYNADQRRQAVEAFAKAGLSYARFGQVWGVSARVLMRWVAAYRKGGPKALEDQRGGQKDEQAAGFSPA